MQGTRLTWAFAAVLATFVGAAAIPAAPIAGQGDPLDAVQGGTVVNFDSGPIGDFSDPVTIDGVTFLGNAPLHISGGFFMGGYNTRGTCALYTGPDETAASVIDITLARTVNAFAFFWGASDVVWSATAYDESDAAIETIYMPILKGSNAGDYFGIRAPGIRRVIVRSLGGGDWIMMDNFTVDTDLVAASARAKVRRARATATANYPSSSTWLNERLFSAYQDADRALLEKCWLDDETLDGKWGGQVFNRLADAAGHLRQALGKKDADALVQEDAQSSLDDAVAAAEQLARTAMDVFSEETGNLSPKAEERYARGVALAEDGKYREAIMSFRAAWSTVQQELSRRPE